MTDANAALKSLDSMIERTSQAAASLDSVRAEVRAFFNNPFVERAASELVGAEGDLAEALRKAEAAVEYFVRLHDRALGKEDPRPMEAA